MKIAYVLADHGIPIFGDKGGAVHVREMVRAFQSLGHDVYVLAARLGGDGGAMSGFCEKVAPDRDHERANPLASDTSTRCAKEEKYIAIAKAMTDRMIQLQSEHHFDLVYERYSLWSNAGVRAAQRLKIPCVLEVNAPLRSEQQKFRALVNDGTAALIERESFGQADLLFAVSDEVAEYAASVGADASNVHVVPNGVDTSRFMPDSTPFNTRSQDEPFTVGFTGGLKIWHGLEILLEAFKRFHQQRPNSRLVIAGDGPMRGYIEGFAQGAGLADNVTLSGWVPHDEIPKVLSQMSVATAPYPPLDDFYFSPLKLFEYLAAGLPIVASRIGQIGQIIVDGESGLLVAPGDIDGLVVALCRLHDDRALETRLGGAAATLAQSHSWRRNAQRVIDLAASRSVAA